MKPAILNFLLSVILGLSAIIPLYAGNAVSGGSTPEAILPQVAKWIPANGGSLILDPSCSYRLQVKDAASDEAKAFQAYLEACPLALCPADRKPSSPHIRITGRAMAEAQSNVAET